MSTSAPTYAHGHSAATVAGHAARTAEFYAANLLPHLTPGTSILDVGCGPGSITSGFVRYVSPGGRVVGVDSSAAVIATAQQSFGGSGVEFLVGDILKLPFEDDTFDVVHAHQVIVHLPFDKVGPALREMKRVCKEGGLVAIRDGNSENGGLQAFPHDPLLAKTMDLLLQRTYLKGGVTPSAQGKWLKIARDEVGFKTVDRRFSLDVVDTLEMRKIWGNQWSDRTEEDGFREFVKEYGLASDEELAELPRAWRKWRDTEDACCTCLHLEHTFRK